MKTLDGKAIVITGSSRGPGAAYAKAAATQGASVVVNGTDLAATERVVAEIRAAGGTAVAQVADIASSDEAERLVQRSVDEFGRIDGLVNNAGVYTACKPFHQHLQRMGYECEADRCERGHLIGPSFRAASCP